MKKIFLSALALFSIIAANAQNDRSAVSSKANADPLVNGIPYSQYKAQQEALKQQNAAKQTTATKNANDPLSGGARQVNQQTAAASVTASMQNGAVVTEAKAEKIQPAANGKYSSTTLAPATETKTVATKPVEVTKAAAPSAMPVGPPINPVDAPTAAPPMTPNTAPAPAIFRFWWNCRVSTILAGSRM